MNIIDIAILCVLGISVILGMHRGFISGLLSLAALIGSLLVAFLFSGQLAAWLNHNETLRATLLYYMDAGTRISSLDLSVLKVSELTQTALTEILNLAALPEAFETAFISAIAGAAGSVSVSSLLSQTILNVSISILSFLICFTVSFVVLTFFIHLINYVFELPVLRHLDSLIGGVFGLVRGIMLLVIFFMLVPIVQSVVPIDMIQQLLNESQLAPMFDSHLILSILGIAG